MRVISQGGSPVYDINITLITEPASIGVYPVVQDRDQRRETDTQIVLVSLELNDTVTDKLPDDFGDESWFDTDDPGIAELHPDIQSLIWQSVALAINVDAARGEIALVGISDSTGPIYGQPDA